MRFRDTYNDYMTRYEMAALLRRGGDLEAEIQRRVKALAIRSGAAGVGSGVVLREPRGAREELRLRVVFDSSAWTGRDTRKRYRTDLVSRLSGWLWDGLRKTLCRHVTAFHRDTCIKCGLTAERMVDHSWRYFPRGVYR